MSWGIVLACLTLVLVIATALSFLRVAHGIVRVFSFPRLQVLLATLVLLAFSNWIQFRATRHLEPAA